MYSLVSVLYTVLSSIVRRLVPEAEEVQVLDPGEAHLQRADELHVAEPPLAEVARADVLVAGRVQEREGLHVGPRVLAEPPGRAREAAAEHERLVGLPVHLEHRHRPVAVVARLEPRAVLVGRRVLPLLLADLRPRAALRPRCRPGRPRRRAPPLCESSTVSLPASPEHPHVDPALARAAGDHAVVAAQHVQADLLRLLRREACGGSRERPRCRPRRAGASVSSQRAVLEVPDVGQVGPVGGPHVHAVGARCR